jgi:hypothetical protein
MTPNHEDRIMQSLLAASLDESLELGLGEQFQVSSSQTKKRCSSTAPKFRNKSARLSTCTGHNDPIAMRRLAPPSRNPCPWPSYGPANTIRQGESLQGRVELVKKKI